MAYGDALRARKSARSRIRRRGCALALLVGALGATMAWSPRPRLLWNASASMPIGLYRIDAAHDVGTGSIVIARVPTRWRAWAAARRYIPVDVPLVKRVAAEPGDTVCAAGAHITVNGRPAAERRRYDRLGRPMPWWRGCVTLRAGALFLLTANPASFDGRYFGPITPADIIGQGHPLWTR
jgi:conjugative transfer signal peptidase TraF